MTTVKSGYSGGSGNSVADYRWKVEVCDECSGEGEVYADFENIRDYIANLYWNEKGIVRKALAHWHALKKTMMLPCRKCNGKGKWEVWY
jgi:DnaJ-class molecular chaperone